MHSRRRRFLLLITLTVAVAAMSHYAAKAVYSQTLARATRVPHTIVTKVTFGKGFHGIRTAQYATNGSFRIAAKASDDLAPAPEWIVDLPAGISISIDPLTKLAFSEPMRRSRMEILSRLPARCEDAFGGEGRTVVCTKNGEKLFGLDTISVVVNQHSVDGLDIRTVAQVAPGLNFEPLTEEKYLNGELTYRMEAISVTLGEPDSRYFKLPHDFRVVDRLSDYLSARKRALGQPIDADELSQKDDWVRQRKTRRELGQ